MATSRSQCGIKADFSVLARFQAFCLILGSRFLTTNYTSKSLASTSEHSEATSSARRASMLRASSSKELLPSSSFVCIRSGSGTSCDVTKSSCWKVRAAVPRHSLPRTSRLMSRSAFVKFNTVVALGKKIIRCVARGHHHSGYAFVAVRSVCDHP